jgi:HPt (histidine-containing phosphotransfer) domain-containing protein
MAHEPAFDWSQAESLLGENPDQVDPDMAAIILELIETSETRLHELKGMDPAADPKPVSSLAHQLRGSLLNFGYTEAGKVLHKIEYREYPEGTFESTCDEALEVFHASNRLLAAKYPVLNIAV